MQLGQTLIPASPNWYGAHLATPLSPRLYAVCAHNSILILDSATGAIRGSLVGHTNRTTAVSCAVNTKDTNNNSVVVVSAAADRTVRVWKVVLGRNDDEIQSTTIVRVLPRRPADVKCIAISSCSTMALLGDIAGNLHGINLTDHSSKLIKFQSCKTTNAITAIAMSPSPSRPLAAIGFSKGYFAIIDWKLDNIVGSFGIHPSGVRSFSWLIVKPKQKQKQENVGTEEAEEGIELFVSTCDQQTLAIFRHDAKLWKECKNPWEYNNTPNNTPLEQQALEQQEHNSNPTAAETNADTPDQHVDANNTEKDDEAPRLQVHYPSIGDLFPLLHFTELPQPPSHLSASQKGRMWFTTAVVPTIYGTGNTNTSVDEDNSFVWLLSSGYAGSLLGWKVPLAGYEKKKDLVGPFKFPQGHSRTIFNIHVVSPSQSTTTSTTGTIREEEACSSSSSSSFNTIIDNSGNTAEQTSSSVCSSQQLAVSYQPDYNIVTSSMDRSVIGWSIPLSSLTGDPSNPKLFQKATVDWIVSGLGGHAYSLSVRGSSAGIDTDDRCLVAVGSGDKTIRVVSLETSIQQETKQQILWHGISDKVTAVAWHPTIPTVIAFACDNGSLGLITIDKQASVMLPMKHKGGIKHLSWVISSINTPDGCTTPQSDDNNNNNKQPDEQYRLMSLSADGALLYWPVWLNLTDLLNSQRSYPHSIASTGASPKESEQQKVSRTAVQLGEPSDALTELSSTVPRFSSSTTSTMIVCIASTPVKRKITTIPLTGETQGDDTVQQVIVVGDVTGGIVAVSTLKHHNNTTSTCLYDSYASLEGGRNKIALIHVDINPADSQDYTTAVVVVGSSTSGSAQEEQQLEVVFIKDNDLVVKSKTTLQLEEGVVNKSSALACRCVEEEDGESMVVVACGGVDGKIQVYKASLNKPIAHVGTLPGHTNAVTSLVWQPLHSTTSSNTIAIPLLVSGSEDQSVMVWDCIADMIAKQEQEVVEIKEELLEEATIVSVEQQQQQQSLTMSSHHNSNSGMSVRTDNNAVSEDNQHLLIDAKAAQKEDKDIVETKQQAVDDDRVSSTFTVQQQQDGGLLDNNNNNRAAPLVTITTPTTTKSKQKKGSTAAPQALLGATPLLSSSATSNNPEQLQEACLTLARDIISQDRSLPTDSSSTISSQPTSLLQYYPDQSTACNVLKTTMESFATATVAAGKLQRAQRAATVALWSGDVGTAIQILTENDALTADFVSMSAAAGREVWEVVVRTFALTLESKSEPHLAALHLLSIGDIHAALEVYIRNGLLHDALAVASARLSPEDSTLRKIHSLIGEELLASSTGIARCCAAGHFIASGDWIKAINTLCTSKTVSAISTALMLCDMVLDSNAVADQKAVTELKQRIEKETKEMGMDIEKVHLSSSAKADFPPGCAVSALLNKQATREGEIEDHHHHRSLVDVNTQNAPTTATIQASIPLPQVAQEIKTTSKYPSKSGVVQRYTVDELRAIGRQHVEDFDARELPIELKK